MSALAELGIRRVRENPDMVLEALSWILRRMSIWGANARGRGQICWIAVLLLVLNACGDIPLRKSKLDSTQTASVLPIDVGVTDRAKVRELLRYRRLSSSYWNVDVFATRDISVFLGVFFYIAIPWWEHSTGYVLVAYDERGKVSAIEEAVAPSEASPTILLSAADFWLSAPPELSDAVLMVSGSRRDTFLNSKASPGRCRLLVGCSISDCPVAISVDDQKAANLYAVQAPAAPVAILELEPGDHKLTAYKSTRKMKLEPKQLGFTCVEGDSLYSTIDVEKIPTFASFRYVSTLAPILNSPEVPRSFRDRPLLIYSNDYRLGQFDVLPEDSSAKPP